MSSPRATTSPAFVAIAAALTAWFVALAYLAPIAGDDWLALLRAHDHGAVAALAAARTPAALVQQVLATSDAGHLALAPLLLCALVVGATALVLGRVPDRRRADDAIATLVVIAAMLVGCPRAGEVWTHRPFLAHHVLGLTAALWLVVPARIGGRLPRGAALALGLVAGLAGRGLATMTLVAVVALAVRAPAHRRWLGFAIAGVALGALRVWIAPPALPALGGGPGGLVLVQDTGELLLWTIVLLVGVLVAARLRGVPLPPPPPRELGAIGWLALAGFAGLALAALPPGPDLIGWFPGTALLAMCVARALLLAADARAARVIGVLAIAVIAGAMITSVSALRAASARAAERDHALRAAPGAIATAAPADPIAASFWTVGEDLGAAARRERVAHDLFGARDLALTPPFRGYEPSPGLGFHATWAAGPPPAEPDYGRSPAEAVRRFTAIAAAARATGELDVDLAFTGRAGRPIAVARARDGAIEAATGRLLGRDPRGRRGVAVAPARLAAATDAWAIVDGDARPAALDRVAGACWFDAPTPATYAIVVCARSSCDLVAAPYVAP